MRRVEKKTGRIGVAHPRWARTSGKEVVSRRHHNHCSTTTEMNYDPIQHGISKYKLIKSEPTIQRTGQSVEATGGVDKRQRRSQHDLCLHHELDDKLVRRCCR